MCEGKIVKTYGTLNFNIGRHTSLNKSNTNNLECICRRQLIKPSRSRNMLNSTTHAILDWWKNNHELKNILPVIWGKIN